MSESQRIGLYYPYLHFSDSWLKVAALYWPRMGRITPPQIPLSDSSTVGALSDELDFTVNVEPGSAAEELTSVLTSAVEAYYNEFQDRYSISANPFMMSNWCNPSWPEPQSTTGDWRIRNPRELKAAAEVVALHTGKGADRLWQTLADAGLAVKSGDWWGLHPELAWLYMCALTDKLARRNLLTPTTDQFIAHIESLSWTDDLFVSTLLEHDPETRAVPRTGQIERIALLALDFVIPSNLEDVPVKKIIKIRKNYAADFDAFYDEVADLANNVANELSGIADPRVSVLNRGAADPAPFARPVPEPAGRPYGALVVTPLLATGRDWRRRGSFLACRAVRPENRGHVCRCRHSRGRFPHLPPSLA